MRNFSAESTVIVPTNPSTIAGTYLTLILNEAAYGIAAEKVREIMHAGKITPMPQFSRHIRGTLNVRGRIIPVMDLRSRLGLLWQSQERSCIVIVQLHGYGETPVMMGLAVDAVAEMVRLNADQIAVAPDSDSSIVFGIVAREGQPVTLLDIDRVVAAELAPAGH